MKKILFLLILALGCFSKVHAAFEFKYEADYITKYCWGKKEYRIEAYRIDCLTDTHAIEFEWSDKVLYKGEGLEQAIRYADVVNKKAGVVMICRRKKPETCEKHYRRALELSRGEVDLWVLKGLSSEGEVRQITK
jgi:hypothetical protein